jgi:hypothetical protein
MSALLLAGTMPSAIAQTPIPSHELTGVFAYFDAKVTLGEFRGRATTGAGLLNGGARLAETGGWIEIRVEDITTGNGRRDRHMRERVEILRFPTFRMEVTGVRADSMIGDTTVVKLTGVIELHGIANEISVPGRVYWDRGGTHVWSEFPLDVRDYGLERPSTFLGLIKMDPVILVGIEAIFGLPATTGTPPS